MNKHSQIARFAPTIAIVVTALTTMAVLLCNGTYLQGVEEESLFVPGIKYYQYCLELPGGLLIWCATWLTQLMHHPWLGAAAYSLLAALATWLTFKAFGLKGISALMAIVPAAMALSAFMDLGYLIFSLKSPGFAFTTLLGLCYVAAAYWAYRSITIGWMRIIAILLAVVAFYSICGAYALFAALLCVIYEAKQCRQTLMISVIAIVAGLAAIVAWPYLWWSLIGGRLMVTDIYTSVLPRLHADEWTMWWPYVLTAVFMAALALTGGKVSSKPAVTAIISVAVALASLGAAIICSAIDSNLNTALKMRHAIDNQQWQEVLETAMDAPEPPTRLNSILTEIALLNRGEAADCLFAYPNGDAAYNTTRDARALHDAAASLIYYQFGQTNLAYRWAMEMKVEHDARVSNLKMLAKTSLANGDYALARKYLTTLSQTMWHRDWAERYMAYADDPSLIDADPELSRIRQLMQYDDQLGVDDGGFELYLRPLIARTIPHNALMVDLAMENAMVSKDLDTFVHWLPEYMRTHKRLPRHYQEAVLMWCYINDSEAYRQLQIDPANVKGFEQFVTAYQQSERMDASMQADYLRAAFGGTFWYYFVISEFQVI